ncbi:MAG TPA: 2-amino-4-hydroxy-6-hydroxymethyldihydropteridine diphosphokinase [Verrucomicrobium sp.]|nr:2-amino-4-hydroxy-6-hydroxymethyldihydropteridine diphosphokinase [Verrucomicrobium sp.]
MMNYGIALGSNLGDRLAHLRAAVREVLRRVPGSAVTTASPVYETAPVDCPEGSPGFLNAVVEFRIDLSPLELLKVTRQIEADLGRPNAHDHHAPRTVDLDLLYADQTQLNHPDLALPHPRMTQRRFVLQPLAVIRPDLQLPGPEKTCTIREWLEALDSGEPPLQIHQQVWLPEVP